MTLQDIKITQFLAPEQIAHIINCFLTRCAVDHYFNWGADTSRGTAEANVDEMLRYLKALVVLQAAMLERKEEIPRTEVLLHRAGMGMREIAELLDKSYAAVAQTISRERRAQRGRGPRQNLLTDGHEHD